MYRRHDSTEQKIYHGDMHTEYFANHFSRHFPAIVVTFEDIIDSQAVLGNHGRLIFVITGLYQFLGTFSFFFLYGYQRAMHVAFPSICELLIDFSVNIAGPVLI